MSAKDFIKEVGAVVSRDFLQDRSILSFEEYIELFLQGPHAQVRNSAQYLRDVFDHFGTAPVLQHPAGPLRRFHYVIVPIVRPILLVGLLYSVVFSFTDFSSVWLLTQGGPYNTTHVFGTYAYNIGINAGDLGMGAAITLFIFPFLALIVILLLRFLRRE